MSGIINEKDYPIRIHWLLKNVSLWASYTSIFLLMVVFFPILVGGQRLNIVMALFLSLFPVVFDVLVVRLLKTARFHFSLDEGSINFSQGIFSRKQRIIPYQNIHNVNISQDFFDRFFKLASVTIEDGSCDPVWDGMDMNGKIWNGPYCYAHGKGLYGVINSLEARLEKWKLQEEAIGFDKGNRVHIPALRKDDALKLKEIIMQRKEKAVKNI